MKILMVCLGNICRSPMAQGIMERKIAQRELNWTVDSAGTGQWHIGEPPDIRSIAVAKENGLDISKQRARRIERSDFDDFDLIFVMDNNNYNNVMRMCNTEMHCNKVVRILSQVDSGKLTDVVPDPYWNDNGFEQVYQLLDAACEYWINKLSEGVGNK